MTRAPGAPGGSCAAAGGGAAAACFAFFLAASATDEVAASARIASRRVSLRIVGPPRRSSHEHWRYHYAQAIRLENTPAAALRRDQERCVARATGRDPCASVVFSARPRRTGRRRPRRGGGARKWQGRPRACRLNRPLNGCIYLAVTERRGRARASTGPWGAWGVDERRKGAASPASTHFRFPDSTCACRCATAWLARATTSRRGRRRASRAAKLRRKRR